MASSCTVEWLGFGGAAVASPDDSPAAAGVQGAVAIGLCRAIRSSFVGWLVAVDLPFWLSIRSIRAGAV